jgi:hypothetical protein
LFAGSTKLSTTLLLKEFGIVCAKQQEELGQCPGNISVQVDGWTNRQKQSVYGSVAITPGQRKEYVLDNMEVSRDKHTGLFLSGKLAS